MSMRLTGMVSGLDTDSLVQELVKVQKMQNKKVEDKKVTLEWKQDIWKTLNSKLYSFYTDQASKLRLQANYQNKSVSSSNENAVDVRANNNAPLGAHKISVKQLASSQYITSGVIETGKTNDNGDKVLVSNSTKLSDLVSLDGEKSITIRGKTLNITANTTVGDVVDTARDAGLNANFDASQQRLFISSKNSGQKNGFDIGGNQDILTALKLDRLDQAGNKVDQETGNSIVIKAQNSEIIYNGASLTGDSNTITANGLTFALKSANPDEEITLNVSNDSQNTYDMIKDFVNGFNEVLGEINTRYNADSARGYVPLTAEEKQALSDDEVEKWEEKIQDSLLRRDSTLRSLMNTLKQVSSTQVEVDGKKYSLSSFGVRTGDYSERGLLHIDGDEDDPIFGSENDKLLKAIEEDPDLVMKVFTEIGRELYSEMGDKMSSVPNVRSAMTFYNDKLMDKELTNYEKQIAKLEDDLYKLEERYYDQFGRLENALAQLESQSNYLMSMFGMGMNQQ